MEDVVMKIDQWRNFEKKPKKNKEEYEFLNRKNQV